MLILTSSNNFVTADFVKFLPKKPSEMKLTFIPTASEVEKGDLSWLRNDRQALVDAGFSVSDFTVTGKKPTEIEKMLGQTDFVFVSGGNTFFLMQEMKKSGFAKQVQSFVDRGGIYGGSSAGSIVAGPDISLTKGLDDPAFASELKDYKGLGLVDIVVFPHWGSEHFQNRYEKVMKSGYKKGLKIVLLTDDQYLLSDQGKFSIEDIKSQSQTESHA